MAEQKNCVTCVHWKGRTDLNKCKIKPDYIPDWYNPNCKEYKDMREKSK